MPAELIKAPWFSRLTPAEQMSELREQLRGATDKFVLAPLDAAVLPCVPAQRRTPPAARARLQPRQLPAHAGPAAGGRALVTHDAAGEAGEDRRPDRAPRPLRGVPARRGGGAA